MHAIGVHCFGIVRQCPLVRTVHNVLYADGGKIGLLKHSTRSSCGPEASCRWLCVTAVCLFFHGSWFGGFKQAWLPKWHFHYWWQSKPIDQRRFMFSRLSLWRATLSRNLFSSIITRQRMLYLDCQWGKSCNRILWRGYWQRNCLESDRSSIQKCWRPC